MNRKKKGKYIRIVLLFVICAIGNVLFGYNTATKEEKEKYDEKKLGRVVGVGLLAIAFLLPFAVLT